MNNRGSGGLQWRPGQIALTEGTMMTREDSMSKLTKLTSAVAAAGVGLAMLATPIVAQSAGGPVGLFPERGCAGMGPQGYLSRYDAVHGHTGDWPDPDLYLLANRTLVANNDLWRISRLWP